jgi:hypothetical protein
MKAATETKIGLGIAVVLGLFIAVLFYAFAGFSGISGLVPETKTTDDVVQAFRDNDLKVGNSYDVKEDPEWGTGMLPKTMDSGTRFEIPDYKSIGGDPATGEVFHFATAKDQKVVSDYLNTVSDTNGFFYTHVYETNGFMLKIDGKVPKDVADSYGEVFKNTA